MTALESAKKAIGMIALMKDARIVVRCMGTIITSAVIVSAALYAVDNL